MIKRTFVFLLGFSQLFFTLAKGSLQVIDLDVKTMDVQDARAAAPAYRFDGRDYLVIQPAQNSAALLQGLGSTDASYLGEGYYLVALPSGSSASTLAGLPLRRVGYLAREAKIYEGLKEAKGSVPVTVLFYPGVSPEALNALCTKAGLQMNKPDALHHHFSTFANAAQLQTLAACPFIVYITRYYEHKNTLMYESSLMMGVNQVQETQPFGFNLKGEGVNVGIWDDGAIGINFDLPVNRNFVIDKTYSFPAAVAHPTYVAGCLGGAGNLSARTRGIASRCDQYYWDVTNDIVQEIGEGKTNYSIDISNHSYNFGATTCYESGLYLPETADLDKLVYENPTLLPVVAVGNSASTCAITDTFSSVDIGFQGLKNGLTVGWLFPDKTLVGNSGRGPTSDGRLKPELVAKGYGISAPAPNNSFQTVYGSSFAAPQIAGLAALLHQKYKQQFGQFPNGALVKAILCNTARDLGNPGPDYAFGFGIPDALRAVRSVDQQDFAEGQVAQDAFSTHSITVPNNTGKLKVTLCWTDKEGSPVAAQSLVNDLDLKLVTPSGDTVLPWKLDPAQYKNNALRGADHLNNIEQVSIDNPAAGTYTIAVKGYSVPYGPQSYAVTYNSQERKIELSHPNGGERLDAGDANKIRWFANGIDTLSKIEFSADSGATWSTVVNNQQLNAENYAWTVPSVASSKCLVRISSGNNVVTSAAPFTIAPQVNFPLINHTVCDRSVKINWPAVTNADAYKIYLFVDSAWVFMGQTSALTYTISNLNNGKLYMYSIATLTNGVESNHSLAKTFTPAAGACTTLNDVGVYAVYKPLGGRKLTSTALTANQKIALIIKNYGTATQNSIPVFYTLNGGPVRSATLSDVLTSNDTSIVQFAVNEDMSAAGTYNIVAWTALAGDNNVQNDTLFTTIKQLNNPPLTLPFLESFETLNGEYSSPVVGLSGLDYADYNPQSGARLRSDEGNLFALSGNKCLALDNYVNSNRRNEVFFTYNLAAYKDSVVFLDFNYLSRGESDAYDSLFVRGNDNRPWVFLYDLYLNRGNSGTYKAVNELNLYQKLKIENGQDFSTATQFRIVQTGIRASTSPFGDGGYSFDDLKLYVAGRDVSVVNAYIKKVNCDHSFTPLPLTIRVKNNSSQPVTNLPVYYKVNNEAPVSEVIPLTINANDTLTYTFNTLFNNSTPGYYSIQTWASNAGDEYRQNDTFNKLSFIVMKTIDSFPYYNDFEQDNGTMFAEGTNSSWAWGTPSKYYMNDAAQESKAWTTGLNKGYNFNEDSYLYMGCMDFSALSTDPLLAFNFITVMQTQSDSAYIEYSTDGLSWKRLGCFNCGLNWYNGYMNQPYWDQIVYPWQVAHTVVPLAALDDKSNFMYRLHLLTDEYIVSEGLGIDDLHVLSDYQEIRGNDSAYVTQTSSGNGWIQFFRNGKLVAELYDDHKVLGEVTLGFEADSLKQKEFDNKNIFPRNWVVKPEHPQPGNFILRLYVLNDEYTNFVLNEDSINRMGDIGLLRYIGLNTNLNIGDNHVRAYYKYYDPGQIQFYPYLNGYYVEVPTDTLGEFYLISTRQDKDAIQNINLVNFSAQKVNDDVYLQWETTREINSQYFVVQYSFDASTFINVDTVPAGGFSNNLTLYNYLHQLNAVSGVYYYRIEIVDNQNKVTYSLIDSVDFTPSVGVLQHAASVKAYVSANDIVVDMQHKNNLPSQVDVYNSGGQLQFSRNMVLTNGVNPLGIGDFTHWSTGVYYLRIRSDEHNYYAKLLKP